MRLNLTENEKVKGLLKKGLRYFSRAVAKFSQTLDFFLRSDALFLPQKLGNCEKIAEKSPDCVKFHQTTFDFDNFILRYLRAKIKHEKSERFSDKKIRQ